MNILFITFSGIPSLQGYYHHFKKNPRKALAQKEKIKKTGRDLTLAFYYVIVAHRKTIGLNYG